MTTHIAADAADAFPAVGRFAGREEFRQRVRDALACAARDGWPQIILSDATFEDWPLGESAVAQSLQAWAKSGRQLTMLAFRYDEVTRHHARFVNWRIQWSHIIECRRCTAVDAAGFPSAIWSPAWVMRRLDPEHSTGVSGSEPDRRVLLREDLEACLRQSSSGFPATTLGL